MNFLDFFIKDIGGKNNTVIKFNKKTKTNFFFYNLCYLIREFI